MQKTVIKDTLGNDIPEANCTMTVYTGSSKKTEVIGFVSEWVNAYTFVSRKYVKYALCVSFTKCSMIITCLRIMKFMLRDLSRARKMLVRQGVHQVTHEILKGVCARMMTLSMRKLQFPTHYL